MMGYFFPLSSHSEENKKSNQQGDWENVQHDKDCDVCPIQDVVVTGDESGRLTVRTGVLMIMLVRHRLCFYHFVSPHLQMDAAAYPLPDDAVRIVMMKQEF